jgi:uncharacterized membrane protein YraQ (UPF0718 family)
VKGLMLFSLIALAVSAIANWQKTREGLFRGLGMFITLLPALLLVLMLVSLVLFLLPNELIIKYLGEGSGIKGWLIAAFFGSVAMIPGFIAYPLAGVLIKSGVAYGTIAVFITTLMMVGIVTLPIEAKFFGWKTSIIRNGLSWVAAIIIGFIMALIL